MVCVLLLAGCRDSNQSELGSVSGTVTLDGKPVDNARIQFLSPNARMAIGNVVDGQIVDVTTYRMGDGAPVGPQAVTLETVLSAEAENALMAGKPLPANSGPKIPAKYQAAATSDLKVEIGSGKNVLELTLESD